MKPVRLSLLLVALSVNPGLTFHAFCQNGDTLSLAGNESFRQILLGLDPFAYDRMISPFFADPFHSADAGQFRFGLEPYRHVLSRKPVALALDTNLGVSEINLVMGSKREQLLFLDHQQRIAKHMKGRLSYNSIVSPGFLLNSLGRHQRILAGLDFSKGRLRSSVDFHYNRLSVDENGGVLPNQDIGGLSLSDFEQLKTRLPDDNRLVRDWQLDLKNEIALSKPRDSTAVSRNRGLFFGLDAGWKRYGTSYTGIVDSSFYPVVYKDSVNTVDSSGYILLRLAPSFSWRFQGANGGFRLDGGFSWLEVSTRQDSASGNHEYGSPFISVSGSSGKMDFNVRYETVLGNWFNQDDFSWTATLKYQRSGRLLSAWSWFVQQRQISPALLMSGYNSNQFRWSNDFVKEIYLKAASRFDFWKGRVSASIDADRVENWVYLNDTALPVQSNDAVSLVKSALQVNSQWRKWRFSLSMIHAMKTGDQLRYPVWSGWTRIAYKTAFFKKALKAELGCTAYGTQSFDALAYMPVTGLPYVQSGFNSGGSPVVDFFFHAGIGKATLSLVVQRINNGLFGEDYYLAPGYPAPPRTLKFVLRWMLYN